MKIGDKVIFIEDVKRKNDRVVARVGQKGTVISPQGEGSDKYRVKIEGMKYSLNYVPWSSIKLI